jgi:tetratricopeptide (TPR) repeat protein
LTRNLVCWLAALPAVLLALHVPAHGQSGGGLDAVATAADGGDLEAARNLLGVWFGSPQATDAGADVPRARYLRARLARDLDSAEVDYLWVAIRGGEPYGPLARLRLAQLRVALGDPGRAEEDLERLRADFPGSPQILSSWLWTGNGRAAAGNPAGACEAWERALRLPPRPESASDRRLAESALARCGPEGEQYGASETFTVQLGAFLSRGTAVELRNRVAATGVAARLIEPLDSSGLYRVRSGRFMRREEAARHAVELASAGFEAIVVPEEP